MTNIQMLYSKSLMEKSFFFFLSSAADKKHPKVQMAGFHRSETLTSEPIEMLAKVTGPSASLKMAFYGQNERLLLSLVTG